MVVRLSDRKVFLNTRHVLLLLSCLVETPLRGLTLHSQATLLRVLLVVCSFCIPRPNCVSLCCSCDS